MRKLLAKTALVAAVLFFAIVTGADAQDSFRPTLSVNIPGLELSRIKVQESDTQAGISGYIDVPWIGEYVLGVYRYALAISGLLAGVMMVIGGFEYMTGKVAAGKEKIKNALIGVVLLFSAYVILATINPDLTRYNALRIKTLVRMPYIEEPSGDTDAPVSPTAFSDPPIDIYCPHTGGAASIGKITLSLENRVAYRFGGKGGIPPGNPPSYKETKAEYLKYNNFCPPGKICLDCSGFVNYVLICAGLKAPNGGTASIFGSGSEATKTFDVKDYSVNGKPLQPGDLVGYLPSESKLGIGHVFLYVGNGIVVESHGGIDGREAKNNPRETQITQEFMEKHIKHVRRTTPFVAPAGATPGSPGFYDRGGL